MMEENEFKFAAIIPARYKSTRFPGKPLAKINGVPMLVRVYTRAKEFLDNVYVATDSMKIKELCEEHNMKCVMTSEDHKTGTDRCAEAASNLEEKYDYYFNIQGDEPVFPADAIYQILNLFEDPETAGAYDVYNCMSKIVDEKDISSIDVPKVVFHESQSGTNELVYMSRSPIPFKREKTDLDYYKQIGLYCFSASALEAYGNWSQTPLEKAESIEILRFLEMDSYIQMLECEGASFSVDRPEDIIKIEHIINTSESK